MPVHLNSTVEFVSRGWITSNVTPGYSLLDDEESTRGGKLEGSIDTGRSVSLYMAIVRRAFVEPS